MDSSGTKPARAENNGRTHERNTEYSIRESMIDTHRHSAIIAPLFLLVGEARFD